MVLHFANVTFRSHEAFCQKVLPTFQILDFARSKKCEHANIARILLLFYVYSFCTYHYNTLHLAKLSPIFFARKKVYCILHLFFEVKILPSVFSFYFNQGFCIGQPAYRLRNKIGIKPLTD